MIGQHAYTYHIGKNVIYRGCIIRLYEFPLLNLMYVDTDPLRLKVNDHEITLADGDIVRRVGQYVFKRLCTNKDEVILIVIVKDEETLHVMPSQSYRLGQPFILEFNEIAGNGYTWWLKRPVEVVQLAATYAGECGTTLGDGNDEAEQDPGCSVIHSFVLKGVKRGKFKIQAIYNRPWQIEASADEEKREYEVLIV